MVRIHWGVLEFSAAGFGFHSGRRFLCVLLRFLAKAKSNPVAIKPAVVGSGTVVEAGGVLPWPKVLLPVQKILAVGISVPIRIALCVERVIVGPLGEIE